MAEGKLLIGKKFLSFQHVEKWIEKQAGPGYKFSVTSSSSIHATKVKGPFADGLKYYEIYYRCSRAGKFKTKGAGLRDYRSQKTGCPALITLRARDKKSLEITDCNMNHNHEKDSDCDGPSFDTMTPPSEVSDDDSVSSVESPSLSQDSDDEPDDDLDSLEKTLPSPQDSKKLINTNNGNSVAEKSPTAVRNTETATAEWKGSKAENTIRFSDADQIFEGVPEAIEQIDMDLPQGNKGSSTLENDQSTVDKVESLMAQEPEERGLPLKNKGAALAPSQVRRKVRKFDAKSKAEKIKTILNWLIGGATLNKVLDEGYKIVRKDLQLTKLKDSIIHESVDINLCEPYMDAQTFKALNRVVENRRKKDDWKCPQCNCKELETCSRLILCDSCVRWYHRACTTLRKNPPKKSSWFCPECK